ncbi:MAG: glutamate-5-semialdehyde dehydrogenase [Promethearchaeota archaeon]
MDPKQEALEKCRRAKAASREAAVLPAEVRVRVLLAMADSLEINRGAIQEANQEDMAAGREKGLSEPLLDRLLLNNRRMAEMVQGLRDVAAMPDELGNISGMVRRPNGLLVGRMRVPLGVVAIVYEARPNVTADAAGLCIKAGNTIVLRGGSEAINSNIAIARVLDEAAVGAGFPEGGIQVIETTDRAAVDALLAARDYVDVLIPRGNAPFIKKVVETAKVNVIETGAGNCHTYVDDLADLDMALELVYNGKVQRPSVCNATKKLLVHEKVAAEFLPRVREKLGEAGVVFLTDAAAAEYFPDSARLTEEELYEEFLDMRLGVVVVPDYRAAVEHVNKYSSHHTEAIVTRDYARAMEFMRGVDSASLFWNASTRFTDGGQFGMGAEIGISTQKLHHRGPMSVRELTCEKFVTLGTGQVRE